MPSIKSSTDLLNNFNGIADLCHTTHEPVFITLEGRGNLALMSIDVYEEISGRLELYRQLGTGFNAIKEGRKRPAEDVMRDIRREIDNASL
ncbi:hypothetical protein FACS1894184_05650 [Clostridia bacterium]|nr:hypothetical protein FACS1894184_05650 [Clostridia bacterium]